MEEGGEGGEREVLELFIEIKTRLSKKEKKKGSSSCSCFYSLRKLDLILQSFFFFSQTATEAADNPKKKIK